MTINYDQSEWNQQPLVVVSDALGRVIFQQVLPSNNTITLPTTISTGIYFIHLRDGEKGSKVLKLMKVGGQ